MTIKRAIESTLASKVLDVLRKMQLPEPKPGNQISAQIDALFLIAKQPGSAIRIDYTPRNKMRGRVDGKRIKTGILERLVEIGDLDLRYIPHEGSSDWGTAAFVTRDGWNRIQDEVAKRDE